MKKKPYLPTQESERVTWLNNFAAKIGGYASTFGISPAEVTAVAAMALIYAYIIGFIENSKTFTQKLTKFKNTLSFAPSGTTLGALPELDPGTAPALSQAGIFTFISGLVMRIKGTKANYTEAIGEDLGIIGDETSFDDDTFTPVIKGKVLPGQVVISFVKGHVEGMAIYSHPVGSTNPDEWVKLAVDNHSPYHDTRPLAVAGKPEVREYKARGVINDVEIGLWSAVISQTFAG